MRIAKYISNSGHCSRRDAEKLISKGLVYINNILCDKPNINVKLSDKIVVEKKLIKLENSIKLWKIYKPTKVICTNKDDKKRKTLFELLPKNFPRVISIGRLDFMSEGLILLTNNGDLARKFELPSSNFIRVYRLCINGTIKENDLQKINQGIKINGINYNKVSCKLEKYQKPYTWMIFKLKEGKNREIRNICQYFNWEIVKLIRIQYGPIKLSKQKIGEIEEIKNISL
jgi:23S rRNA pseudouridine2605 synthase|tara:strand:- start:824 stop:1510 length:687 start_codon:yes stop_codon:yes gene_type:complete